MFHHTWLIKTKSLFSTSCSKESEPHIWGATEIYMLLSFVRLHCFIWYLTKIVGIDGIDKTGLCSFLTCLWEYVSCHCLSRGQNLSWRPINSHWCLLHFVPASPDRRSYYFFIALVASVPQERFPHVTDSSVNPRPTSWGGGGGGWMRSQHGHTLVWP